MRRQCVPGPLSQFSCGAGPGNEAQSLVNQLVDVVYIRDCPDGQKLFSSA